MDYTSLKVADLKGLLKERGIPSTGLSRKQQIVEALEAHDTNGGGATAPDGDAEVPSDGAAAPVQSDADVEEAEDGTGPEETPPGGADVHGNGQVEKGSASFGADSATDPTAQPPPASDAPPEASSEPTVLESNKPVSKEPSALTTPRQISPMAESTSSDRKRKRRSPTPPVDEETVSKKLKAAEGDVVALPEDRSSEQGMAGDALSAMNAANTANPEHGQMETDVIEQPQSDDVKMGGTTTLPESADSVERSIHPATRAIYIHNLVRPIQPAQLESYLTELATTPEGGLQPLDQLHLGSIRTHAFAIFHSKEAASRARAGLHGQVWPDEPARKALWVDFVPDDKVPEWIDRETEGGGGRRDTRRWEVLYDETDEGVVARHEEATGAPGASQRRPSNIDTAGHGQGMPNAPLGPRSSRPSVPDVPPKQTTPNPTSSASFDLLDQRFPSTTVKPKLYFLPVTKELADRRLDELERQTSREWGARGGEMVGGGGVRRYTFEDGDRLVDGGPHYDDFSGPRRGGGRGRGGGFRGRR